MNKKRTYVQVTSWVVVNIETTMSYDRLPNRIAGQMTVSQASTLRSLAGEAYQEKLFEPGLAAAEAARRIDLLKRQIALANSFCSFAAAITVHGR
jgi:DUF3072 family protein